MLQIRVEIKVFVSFFDLCKDDISRSLKTVGNITLKSKLYSNNIRSMPILRSEIAIMQYALELLTLQ